MTLYFRQRQLYDIERPFYELMLKMDVGYIVNNINKAISDR